MRTKTALLVRAGVVALALGWIFSHGARAAESPTAFFIGQQAPSYAMHGAIRIWRKVAHGHRRVWREQTGSRSNPVSIFAGDVVAALRRHLGQGNFTHHQGQPWCAYGLSEALVATGHRPLASGMAASALSYGPHLSAPRVGAIAALGRRGRIYHVGLVESIDGDRIGIISANWSHRVSRAVLPRRAFVAFVAIPEL